MATLRIYKEKLKYSNVERWWIEDSHGIHPVTFELGDVTWNVHANCELAVNFKFWNTSYLIRTKNQEQFYIARYATSGRHATKIDELILPRYSPFTAYFKKTGQHVVTGKTITIPIYHTFDKQMY